MSQLTGSHVAALRRQFPGLSRRVGDRPAVFLDGPAGSQAPQRVIDAVGHVLAHSNANHDGPFATSRECDAMLEEAHRAAAELLGGDDPDCVAFGPNMTTLTLALSRALARTWQPGDEVLLTRLEHDANFTPWVLAAGDAGATVRYVGIRRDDCTLDLDDLRNKLNERTRLVAVGAASNAVGTINPVSEVARAAHAVGAELFVDAVHYAPHALVDVAAWDCDYLACSAYKFFGPHVGLLWGRRELLERLAPYKLRPAPDELPGRWMTGTQNHEGIAGTLAAIDYLADLGRQLQPAAAGRRQALAAAFAGIVPYEQMLVARLIAGLQQIGDVRVWGIVDPARSAERVPTVAFTHRRLTSQQIAEILGERGIFCWPGNYYALPLTEALGLEPDGAVRLGLLHYNTTEEVDRAIEEIGRLGGKKDGRVKTEG